MASILDATLLDDANHDGAHAADDKEVRLSFSLDSRGQSASISDASPAPRSPSYCLY